MSYLTPTWPAPKNVHSMITTKKSLLSHKTCTRQDSTYRHALVETLNLPTEPIWLSQTHSNKAITAIPNNRNGEADASVADLSRHIAVVFTADCLPLLVCNKAGTKVAAIHAGWRGLLHGVIANSLELMNENPHDLLVYLGPAIGPLQFEVGHDVHNAFIAKEHENAKAFTVKSHDKWLANIYTLASIQLNALGIDNSQIYGGTHCTVSESDLFFSYRRDHGQTGRIASLIWFD